MLVEKIYNVKTPSRGTKLSAGIDFYVPEFSKEFLEACIKKNDVIGINLDGFVIKPGQHILIPSGIKVKFDDQYVLIAFNKSGVSAKLGLDVLGCVVDADYQGVVHISLVNTSNKDVQIEYGQKIVQFLLMPIIYDTIIEGVNIHPEKTERSDGAFGSTGK